MSDALMLAVWAVGCFLAGWLACGWWQDRKLLLPLPPTHLVEPIETIAHVIWLESIEPSCRNCGLRGDQLCTWGLTLDCPCQDRAFDLAAAVMEPEKEKA